MESNQLDRLFADAVGAIDNGDLTSLRRILDEHPETVAERLESPGAWSGVAADCGVQLPLIGFLVSAGAAITEIPDNALVNRHVDAARRLIELGGELTLASGLCLERWDEIEICGPIGNVRHSGMTPTISHVPALVASVRPTMLGSRTCRPGGCN